MKLRSLFCQLMFLGGLLLPVSSVAAATVSIVPAGDGAFTLRAADMVGIDALDVEVRYDTASLKDPRVVAGRAGNALSSHNPAFKADTLKFALIADSGLPREFVVATITFSRTGSAPGAITGLSARTVNSSGKSEMARTSITNPTVAETGNLNGANPTGDQNNPDGSPDDPGTGGGNGTGDGTYYGDAIAGTITLPGDPMAEPERGEQTQEQPVEQPSASPEITPVSPDEGEEQPAAAPAAMEESAPAAPDKEGQPASGQSVLERFRLYQGEKSVPKLSALFDQERSAGITQEPRILIGDGDATVTVTIQKVPGAGAPNFAFQGARYVSMKRVADGGWQIKAKPNKGVINPSITMLADGQMHEIPLTVAPKARVDLMKPGTVTRADFELFLKERGTPEAPKYDLNGDGRRDYQDDFIFAANWLVADKVKEAPATEVKAPAEVKNPVAEKKAPEVKKPAGAKDKAPEKKKPRAR